MINILISISGGVIHWINVRDDNCCCSGLYRLFADKSTRKQWRNRIPMDIALGVHISILIFSSRLLTVFAMDRSADIGLSICEYIGSVFVLQIMYYLTVYMMQRWNSQFNSFGIHFCRDIAILQKCLFLNSLQVVCWWNDNILRLIR